MKHDPALPWPREHRAACPDCREWLAARREAIRAAIWGVFEMADSKHIDAAADAVLRVLDAD